MVALEKSQWILTPKNLYRLLTGRLPGIPQREIFPSISLKGLTLVRFWRDMLQDVLNTETLDAVFPLGAYHPRFQSNLMNRSSATPMPALLRDGLRTVMGPDLLLTLCRNSTRFLALHHYREDIYREAFRLFEEGCTAGDFFLRPAISQYLQMLRSFKPEPSPRGIAPSLFADALYLSWMVLFALYGPHMGEEELSTLRAQTDCTPFVLWMKSIQSSRISAEIQISADSELKLPPLPAGDYFPLSLSPEALADEVEGSRILLTGAPGSGKSELLRQSIPLFRSCGRYRSVICAAPDSIPDTTPDMLLIIDEYNDPFTEEQLSRLLRHSGDVLLVGRYTTAPGFRQINIPPMTSQTGVSLFFRVARLREDEDNESGAETIVQLMDGNPDAIRLLAEICHTRYWSAKEILTSISRHGLHQLRHRDSLGALLRSRWLMPPVSADAYTLLRLLAVLPEQPWKPDMLLPFCEDMETSHDSTGVLMRHLAEHSLLQEDISGYRLPAPLAFALRDEPIQADQLPLFWQYLAHQLSGNMTPEKQALSVIAEDALLHTGVYHYDAIQVLLFLEDSMMSRKSQEKSLQLLDRHAQWLDTQSHEEKDELNYQIMRLLGSALLQGFEGFITWINKIASHSTDLLLASNYYDLLLNVLDYGAREDKEELGRTLFEKLQSPQFESREQIVWFNFYGSYLRNRKRFQEARVMLEHARYLISKLRLEGDIVQTANDTRLAYVYADMSRYEEALPLMRRVLDSMQARGYAQDSKTFVNTQNAYNHFLSKCSERRESLLHSERKLREMEATTPETEMNLLYLQNNYLIQLKDARMIPQASAQANKILDILRRHPEIAIEHRVNYLYHIASVLLMADAPEDALAIAAECAVLCEAHPEWEAYSLIRIQWVMADCMWALHHPAESLHMLHNLQDRAAQKCPDHTELLDAISASLSRAERELHGSP